MKAKLIRCLAPLPEAAPNPVLTRMLQIMLSAEGEEGDQGATASTKETVRKGGIDKSPNVGKKRSATEDPEGMTSKRGKKASSEDPAPETAPAALCPWSLPPLELLSVVNLIGNVKAGLE